MFINTVLVTTVVGLLAATNAAPTLENRAQFTCPVPIVQAVQNHGFEQGAVNWTLAGGASVVANGDGIDFDIHTFDGTHFGYVPVNL